MADIVPPEVRSRMMAGIKSKDTKPEMKIRRMLHAAGFRYRLHDDRLPGRPDIVLPKFRSAVFIHGCFWHGHNCHLSRLPKTRTEFWVEKINSNRMRDIRTMEQLNNGRWRYAVIWECAIKGKWRLTDKELLENIQNWLHSDICGLVLSGEMNATRFVI